MKDMVFINCCLDDLKLLQGYTINSVCVDSDEDFLIKASRVVDNVEIGREFCCKDGEFYISCEYVKGIHENS